MNDTSYPDDRRMQLGKLLVELSPSREQMLKDIAHTAPDTTSLVEVIRSVNEGRAEEEKLPMDEAELLSALIRLGSDERTLWRLIVTSRDPLQVYPLLQELAPQFGGILPLLNHIRPYGQAAVDFMPKMFERQQDYFQFIKDSVKEDGEITNVPVKDWKAKVIHDPRQNFRLSIAAVLQDTHPNDLTRDRKSESEMYDEDIQDKAVPTPCYVSINPPQSGDRDQRFVFRVALPWSAEVARIPQDEIAELQKFLTLDSGLSLGDLIQSGESFEGNATLKVFVPVRSEKGRLPKQLWKHLVR